eukprot:COSAG06_NODE_53729_length_298_cov_1.000000_1_plen_36_part_01
MAFRRPKRRTLHLWPLVQVAAAAEHLRPGPTQRYNV